jgi:phosphate uptake regulator
MMDTALRALFSDSYELAEGVLAGKEKTSGLEAKLVERLLREKMPASELSAYRLISESLRRIGEYATDVAEVVLNLTVHKSIERLVKPATSH